MFNQIMEYAIANDSRIGELENRHDSGCMTQREWNEYLERIDVQFAAFKAAHPELTFG